MAGEKVREFNYEKAEIGEELGSYEYVLTQEMLDNFRASVDDSDAPFPTLAVKHDATKLRSFQDGAVWCGFAGAAADSFALLDRFGEKLDAYKTNIRRAAIELAKEWRSDKVLRRLDALLIVSGRDASLMISGRGDVIEPSHGVIGVGSGGMYAVAAAEALVANTDLTARQIVEKSLHIAADICVYTNHNIHVETID